MEHHEHRVAGIIAAAGAGRRFGAWKPGHMVGGRSMLESAIETLRAAGAMPIVVVSGAEPARAAEIAEAAGVKCIDNPDWHDGGMLSSIQAGVRALPPGMHGVFVLPADMPSIRSATAAGFGAEIRRIRPVLASPRIGAENGHPLYLAADLIPELLTLGRGESLRDVVRAHAAERVLWPCEDEGITMDVDRPADLERLKKIMRSQT